jgi:Zn-finger nucleic acid-binding protein
VLSLRRDNLPAPSGRSCRQCGRSPSRPEATICARCGIAFGDAPRADAELPTCPVCYQTVPDDGLLASLAGTGRRLPIAEHIAEHDRHPVGDDHWLESLRQGDRIPVGRWYAPFDLVRRYFVTGAVDGGRNRQYQHDAIVNAMTQLARWGEAADRIVGDQAAWREARAAVSALMERYHRR